MIVSSFVKAKWGLFLGSAANPPAPRDLAFDASNVSPIDTKNVPEITVTVSVSGWKCGATLYSAGNFARSVKAASLLGSPWMTATFAPFGNAGGASTQLMSVGLTRMGDSSAWNEPNAAMATIAIRCFIGFLLILISNPCEIVCAVQGASNTFHHSSRPIRAP